MADTVLVGGGIGLTFTAIDSKVGKSLHEPDFIPACKDLKSQYGVVSPVDYLTRDSFSDDSKVGYATTSQGIPDGLLGLDIGQETIKTYVQAIQNAKTILIYGCPGIFEFPNFRKGTKEIMEAATNNQDAFVMIGGGEALAAADLFELTKKFSLVSSGGGAFVEMLEGKVLPGIAILQERSK